MSHELGQTSSADQPPLRKRPRPIISCLRCREKKLKCDRSSPCENCAKADCASTCEYQHASGEAKRARLVDEHTLTDVRLLEDLQRRLGHVERLLGVTPQEAAPVSSSTVDVSAVPNGVATTSQSQRALAPPLAMGGSTFDRATAGEGTASATQPLPGTLVVKGTRSRVHGRNSRMSLMNEIGGAKETIGECMNDKSLYRLAKEVQFLQKKINPALVSPRSTSDTSSSPELAEMHAFLPNLEVRDALVNLYTENFEQNFRVLHLPTFIRQYTDFTDQRNLGSDGLAGFVPQLTAVFAVAISMADEGFQQAYPSVCGYLQGPAIDLLYCWLLKVPRKQRTELSTLQTETLTLLARWLRPDSPEELWRASGSLVRSAMVVGLHLDPAQCADFSVFQQEQRRRLWTTILELDLQASVASGMPVSINSIDAQSLARNNIDDADYGEHSTQLPPPKPPHECTNALSQLTLAATLIPRFKAVTDTNLNLSQALRLSDELYADTCHRSLALFPRPGLIPCDAKPLLFSRVVLDLCFYRPYIYLCQAILQLKMASDKDSLSVKRSLLSASLDILSHQKSLDTEVPKRESHHRAETWDLLQRLTKGDMIRAALTVCQYINVAPNPWTKDATKEHHISEVEYTIKALIRHLGKPGGDVKDVILLAVALHQARSHDLPEHERAPARESLRKVMSECRQYLLNYPSNLPGVQGNPSFEEAPRSSEEPPGMPQAADPFMPLTDIPRLWDDDPNLVADFDRFMADPLWIEMGDPSSFFANS